MAESVSGVIIVKNGARTLGSALEALSALPEVVVADTGSEDDTRALAASFENVRLVEIPFEGFGPTKRAAVACATHDWVLCIDADEVAGAGVAEALVSMEKDPQVGYAVSFANFMGEKQMRCCGWGKDQQVVLFHRQWANFDLLQVHEKVVPLFPSAWREELLPLSFSHYPYPGLEDFLVKMHRYGALYAREHAGKKKSSLRTALLHGVFAFLKSYLFRRGWFFGREGFILSLYQAEATYWKYLLLLEANSRVKEE